MLKPNFLNQHLVKKYCSKCPYKLGYIKYIQSPCLECKVYGGPNEPPSLEKLMGGKKHGNFNNKP